MKSQTIGENKFNPVSFIEGNRAFRRIAEEIRDLLLEYGYEKLDTLEEKKAAINFVYQCVFFGAGDDGLNILKEKFNHNHSIKKGIYKEFFNRWEDPKNSEKNRVENNPKNKLNFASKRAEYNDTIYYYGGHVRHLGHYFRNIYQAVKYVELQDFLSEKQKYDYITILRAQMSVYEQEVFFYTTLSDLGDVWEWKHLCKRYPNDIEKEKVFNKLWVTKYDFIRNVILNHNGVIAGTGVNIKDFYPLVNMEGENEFKIVKPIPFYENKKAICRFCFNKKYIQYYKDDKEELKKAEQEIRETFKKDDFSSEKWICSEKPCETKKLFT